MHQISTIQVKRKLDVPAQPSKKRQHRAPNVEDLVEGSRISHKWDEGIFEGNIVKFEDEFVYILFDVDQQKNKNELTKLTSEEIQEDMNAGNFYIIR